MSIIPITINSEEVNYLISTWIWKISNRTKITMTMAMIKIKVIIRTRVITKTRIITKTTKDTTKMEATKTGIRTIKLIHRTEGKLYLQLRVKSNHKLHPLVRKRSQWRWPSQKMMKKKNSRILKKELQRWKIEQVHLLDHHSPINSRMRKIHHSLMKGKLQLRLTQMVEKLRPLNTSATMEKWRWVFLDQNKEEKEQMCTRNIISWDKTVLEKLMFSEDIVNLIYCMKHFSNVIQDSSFLHFHLSKTPVTKRNCSSMKGNISWINS